MVARGRHEASYLRQQRLAIKGEMMPPLFLLFARLSAGRGCLELIFINIVLRLETDLSDG